MIRFKNSIFVFFALGLLSFFSCQKAQEITISWAFFDVPFDDDFTAIEMETEALWHITGGDTWSKGIYAKIEHDSIRYDSIAPKRLNAMTRSNGQLAMVGYTGLLLSQKLNNSWTLSHVFDNYNILRDIDMLNDSFGITVAGVAFHSGLIYQLGKNQQIIQIDSFDKSIQAVHILDRNHAIAAGYGIILALQDGSWKQLPNFGDFYLDIDFPTPDIGYIIGNAGSLLKSTDAGKSWTKIINKNTYSNKTAFRAVHFVDGEIGYITGEHGLLWKTKDGGTTWIHVQALPDIDFRDIDVIGEKGVLVGVSGTIITFDTDF